MNLILIKSKKIKILFLFFALYSISYILYSVAETATLTLSPSFGSYAVGSKFSIVVYISSPNEAMNAVSGVLSFPVDKLQIGSLSKTGSIVSLWVQEPSFSSGAINFEGIVLNPGFSGNRGKLLTATFTVKDVGKVNLSFNSGSVLANDGSGTNILKDTEGAQFDLVMGEILQPETGAVKISSLTHPDPEKWYVDNNPIFEWSIAKDVSSVSILLDRSPTTDLSTSSDGLFSTYSHKYIDEGVWYVHLRLRSDSGWSKTNHFRFQVDTEKPIVFNIREAVKTGLNNDRGRFIFQSEDKTSGIAYYEVQIDNGEWLNWQNRDDIYETYPLQPGEHQLVAKAFDKAGNYLMNSIEFITTAPTAAPAPPKDFLLMTIIVLMTILVWLFYFGRHYYKRRSSIHEVFDTLREDVDTHSKDQLKQDLKRAEKILEKEK